MGKHAEEPIFTLTDPSLKPIAASEPSGESAPQRATNEYKPRGDSSGRSTRSLPEISHTCKITITMVCTHIKATSYLPVYTLL